MLNFTALHSLRLECTHKQQRRQFIKSQYFGSVSQNFEENSIMKPNYSATAGISVILFTSFCLLVCCML